MNILVSIIIFLSSFYVYAQDTTLQDNSLLEIKKNINSTSKKINETSDQLAIIIEKLKAIKVIKEIILDPRKHEMKYDDYAFFKQDMKGIPLFSIDGKKIDFKEGVTSDDVYDFCDFRLFGPKTLAITAIGPDVWFFLAKNEDDIQAFFPVKIVSKRVFPINGVSYIEYITALDSSYYDMLKNNK